jgi:DDE superfamily endonuclease
LPAPSHDGRAGFAWPEAREALSKHSESVVASPHLFRKIDMLRFAPAEPRSDRSPSITRRPTANSRHRPTRTGRRHRRTAVDFAEVVRMLVEEMYPEAEKIVLVMDNLDTHKLASLYEALSPEQARRIADRLEIHHTPKHGSWLNMAEIELSALSRQCLGRRIETREELKREEAAWERERNKRGVPIRWRFTTADARIKPRQLYPTIQ